MSVLLRSMDLNESREVDVEGGDRYGDLPPFKHFGVNFSDDTQRLSRYHNLPCPAFQERRMLNWLESVVLSHMLKQDVQAGMNLRKMRRRMGDRRTHDRLRT